MAQSSYSTYLQCNSCENVEFADTMDLVDRLRKLGMLRRDAKPDGGVVKELVERMSDGFKCSTCGSVGMTANAEDPFDDEDWGQGRKCDRCSEIIPAERMEVFPDSRLCMKCQAKADSGDHDDGEVDYCAKCGDARQLRKRPGSGIAGYQMYCPTCRR